MWKRCYNAPGTHGFAAKDFHDACDRKGPTVTMALLRDGRRAAAYTPASWTSAGYVYTPSAMLYSITTGGDKFKRSSHRSRHPLKCLLLIYTQSVSLSLSLSLRFLDPVDVGFAKLRGENDSQGPIHGEVRILHEAARVWPGTVPSKSVPSASLRLIRCHSVRNDMNGSV
jgi:hypothetical protein